MRFVLLNQRELSCERRAIDSAEEGDPLPLGGHARAVTNGCEFWQGGHEIGLILAGAATRIVDISPKMRGGRPTPSGRPFFKHFTNIDLSSNQQHWGRGRAAMAELENGSGTAWAPQAEDRIPSRSRRVENLRPAVADADVTHSDTKAIDIEREPRSTELFDVNVDGQPAEPDLCGREPTGLPQGRCVGVGRLRHGRPAAGIPWCADGVERAGSVAE